MSETTAKPSMQWNLKQLEQVPKAGRVSDLSAVVKNIKASRSLSRVFAS